jgi:hypothetical protein
VVEAVDDDISEKIHHAGALTASTSSSMDEGYASHDIIEPFRHVEFEIVNNYVAGMLLSSSDGSAPLLLVKECAEGHACGHGFTAYLLHHHQYRTSTDLLIFNEHNWNIPQEIVVYARDDFKDEDDGYFDIRHQRDSDDHNYGSSVTYVGDTSTARNGLRPIGSGLFEHQPLDGGVRSPRFVRNPFIVESGSKLWRRENHVLRCSL